MKTVIILAVICFLVVLFDIMPFDHSKPIQYALIVIGAYCAAREILQYYLD